MYGGFAANHTIGEQLDRLQFTKLSFPEKNWLKIFTLQLKYIIITLYIYFLYRGVQSERLVIVMLCCGRTDIGKMRRVNQDSFMCETFDNGMLLAVVCDGMGGAAGGGIASGLACGNFVDSVTDFAEQFPRREKLTRSDERIIKSALSDAAAKANAVVYERSRSDEELVGMGTTLVAALVYCNVMFTVNIGDSRLYLIHNGKAVQVTHDHSFVQYLVDKGKMTPEEARISINKNIITRAIGTDSEIEADIFVNRLSKKSLAREYIAVLCSDGLSNHLSPEDIAATVTDAVSIKTDRGLGAVCEELIDMANDAGGSDNITAVVVTV